MAGHISNAQFEIDGTTHFTSANGNNGTTTFNGGERGWERMTFDVGSHTPNSITFVVFDRLGKNGFPGNSGSSLTHSVYKNEWRMAYGVTPTRTSTRVPINLSHKTFFNLDGFSKGSETIKDHKLRLPFSGLRLEEDEHGIPTGDIKGNKLDTPLDFWSESKRLSESLGQLSALDHLFLVQRPNPWHKDSDPVASLSSDRSGIKVDLYTDQEAVRLLTWDEGEECKLCCILIRGFR
jgi:aldose 1-epimerase